MKEMTENHPIYRPEIDGLRALSILPVIFYHAGFDWMEGGFIGVDVFFVISGYLITAGIFYELANSRFSLGRFYARRVRRIAPAFIVVLLFTTLIAWVWLLPNEMRQYSESLVGAASMTANIFFYLTGGYFGTLGSMKPLLHTWSLSLEEQFYLCFPLFILLFWNRIDVFKSVLLVLVIVSLIYSEYITRVDKNFAYFMLQSRFWELGVGSCIAIFGGKVVAGGVRPFIASGLTALGVVIILACSVFLSAKSRFPGFMAILPCLAASLVIIFADSRRRNDVFSKLLAARFFVSLGLISYSLYLWHQPLFALYRHRVMSSPSAIDYWLLICVSIVLAILTREFIELRFLRLKDKALVKFNLATGVLAIFLFGFGCIGHITEGYPFRMPSDAKVFHVTRSHEKYLASTGCSRGSEGFDLGRCKKGELGEDAKILLIGDSHAQSIEFELNDAAKAIGVSFYPLVKSGCATNFSFEKKSDSSAELNCMDYQLEILDLASTRKDFSTVIVFNRFDDPNFATSHESRVDSFAGHLASIKKLLLLEKRVIVILPIPVYLTHISDYYSKNSWFYSGYFPDVVSSRIDFNARMKYLLAQYDALKDFGNLVLIDPSSVLCDSRYCHTRDGLDVLYFDDDHLSNFGAKRIVALLKSELR